jgi:hypothetical protein
VLSLFFSKNYFYILKSGCGPVKFVVHANINLSIHKRKYLKVFPRTQKFTRLAVNYYIIGRYG